MRSRWILLAAAAAVLGFPAIGAEAPALGRTEILVRLDPEIHRMEATAVLHRPGPEPESQVFEISARLTVKEVRADGEKVAFEVAPQDGDSLSRITVRSGKPSATGRRYTFTYEGEIHDPPKVAQFSREQIADQTKGTIQSEGVFLTPDAGWYPRVDRSHQTFRLEARLPAGWDAVAEGSLVPSEAGAAGVRVVYDASRPTEGLHLVAGKWRRIDGELDGVTVSALVYPDDVELGVRYAAAIRRYLRMYTEWLGPYPYDRFSVAENFFSTGYGMAGFTVLGQDVMRLPFIVDTSLGHEVAHSWWGNGVFVDEAGGNWCEGLTTFVADYHYRRLKGEEEGAEYRRELCRDYTNYVAEAGKDFPLTEFTERTTAATRAVGYGKTAMVFSMLEERLGKERFDAVLRAVYRDNQFRSASWDTWTAAFSKAAGEDLGWFFDQWVRRSGAPSLALGSFRVSPARDGSGFDVAGEIAQRDGAWRLRVPLVFEGGGQSQRVVAEVREAVGPVRATLPFRPEVLRVDPSQEVFRKLAPAEIPAVLSRVLGDPKALFVLDDTAGDGLLLAYREIGESLTRAGMGEVRQASQLTSEALQGRNVFLLGLPTKGPFRALLEALPREVTLEEKGFKVEGSTYAQPGDCLLAVAPRPNDPSRAVALLRGLDPDAVRAAGRKLTHYGKYSYLVFTNGKNVAKGVARVEGGPLVLRFDEKKPKTEAGGR